MPADPVARATDVADVPRPKRTRNNRKGADRARRIMEIAEQMFHERGYAETSMEDIAQAVGLLKGSLYYYVSSKEDLLYRIVDDVHETVAGLFESAIAMTELTAVQRLERYVIDQVMFNAKHVPRIAVYHHEWHRLEGDRLAEVRGRRRHHELAVIALLEEAKADGDTRPDLDVKLAAASAFAVTIWPYTWYRPGTISAARLSRACADFILGGLRGPA
jgi:TetR/AcrR family transcriptional regulator, cholesterol catabolism regulator